MRRSGSFLRAAVLLLGLVACGSDENPKENCSNGKDDDSDGFVDCADGSCAGDPACLVAQCGDGERGEGEECDGSDLNGQSCESLDLGPGALACKTDCSFDTRDCAKQSCGNGHKDPGEACDGPDLAGKTCETEGRVGGTLGCMPDCTIDVSACGSVELCNDGSDNDKDKLFDCSDPDCFQHTLCATGGETVCDDLIDDDGDGLIDCQDPDDCQKLTICLPSVGKTGAPCLAPRDCAATAKDPVCLHQHDFDYPEGYCTEFCLDGVDDCPLDAVCVGQIPPSKSGLCIATCLDDAECRTGYECNVVINGKNGPIKGCVPTSEVCSGGIDDDSDGLIDCQDPGCDASPSCVEDCQNGLDDDSDGKVDCKDRGCRHVAQCHEACNNDLDDDGDGLIDCKDADCRYTTSCIEDCTNQIDDNGNGLVDCLDTLCKWDSHCVEDCFNGIDDDGDGLADCADKQDCKWACPEPEICFGGEDEDLDGFVDCEDPECQVAHPNCFLASLCTSAPALQNGVTQTGTTVGGSSQSKGFCAWSNGGLERIYRFDAGSPGDYGLLEVNFDSMGNNLALYIRSDCADPFAEQVCAVGSFSAGAGVKGGTYWVFVDGATASDQGSFALTLTYTVPVCGDGILEKPEECDPPDGITCDANCQLMPPPETDCGDLIDNDNDNYHDCIDPDCQGQPICIPGNAPVGSVCGIHTDCAATGGDPICLYTWPDGYCSEGCDTMQNDCPMGALCVPASPTEGLCVLACQSDADCRANYACQDLGFGNMCYPF